MRYTLFCIAFSISLAAQESRSTVFTEKLHACTLALTNMLSSIKLPTTRFSDIPTLSVTPASYPYLIGSCGIAVACCALGSYIRTQYHRHEREQRTLGAWIAEMEQQSIKADTQLTPELQHTVSQFLAVDMHNYLTLKKAVSSDALKDSYDFLKKNSLYELLPLLESDCLKPDADNSRLYSIIIDPEDDRVNTHRREFFIKNGHCIATHFYTYRATPNNAFGIKGIYETSCYYPKNESDVNSACAQYLITANALIETKKKYDLFHGAWQAHTQQTVTAQIPPWDAQLYTWVLTELTKHRCKGQLTDKSYCIRTVRCEARDIVAAFKEYEFWMQTENQQTMQACHTLDAIGKAKEQARELFLSKTTRTPFSFEQLNDIKKGILQKNKS